MAMVGFQNFYGGCKNCKSTWDHIICYADRSSKDEQLLVRTLLEKKLVVQS
jgi:hypothetical protein